MRTGIRSADRGAHIGRGAPSETDAGIEAIADWTQTGGNTVDSSESECTRQSVSRVYWPAGQQCFAGRTFPAAACAG